MNIEDMNSEVIALREELFRIRMSITEFNKADESPENMAKLQELEKELQRCRREFRKVLNNQIIENKNEKVM